MKKHNYKLFALSAMLVMCVLFASAAYAYATDGTLVLPEDVTVIEEQAFYGLTDVTRIVLPDGVTTIGDNAFGGSESLQAVSVSPDLPGVDDLETLSARILTGSPNAEIEVRAAPGVFKYDVVDGHAVIKGYQDGVAAEEVCILPSAISGYPVTEIAASAFSNNSTMKKVVIPDGVTTIGNYAFYYCTHLTDITLPTGLISVGKQGFYRCGYYEDEDFTLMLPDGITTIGDERAFDCKGTVQCNVGTATIRALMDSGCSGFCIDANHDMIYKGVTYKGKKELFLYKYEGDKSKLTSMTIPEGVVGIYDEAVKECKKLTELHLPDTLKKIGYQCFSRAGQDSGVSSFYVFLPDGLEEIELGNKGAFFYAEARVIFECNPGSNASQVLSLSWSHEFTIPNRHDCLLMYKAHSEPTAEDQDHTENRLYLTYYMGNEVHVTVPNGVEVLGPRAFSHSKYHTDGKNETMTDVALPQGMVGFESSAFLDCTALQSIDIPAGFTEIKGNTFEGCTSLTRVTFPASLTKIGHYAFSDCGSASQETFYFYLPDHITGDSYKPFSNCNAVLVTGKTSETAHWLSALDNTCVSGAVYDFSVADELDFRYRYKNVQVNGINVPYLYVTGYTGTGTQAAIPAGPTYIDDNSFKNKTNLTKLIIPEGIIEVGVSAFEGCVNLTDITFPESLKVLKNQAFKSCGSNSDTIHYYILPDTMTEIPTNVDAGWGAFGGLNKGYLVCSIGSATAKLLSGITNGGGGYNFAPKDHYQDGLLYRYERHDNTDLLYLWEYTGTERSEIIIPDDIGLYGISRTPPGGSETWVPVFSNHTEITKVVIPEGVQVVENFAFRGCTLLTDITLPSSLRRIGQHSFERVGLASEQRFIVVLPASLEEITAGSGAGWDSFNDSTATLVALNATIRTALYEGWYYYYESYENAVARVHMKYKESSDPDQKYRGGQ